MGTRGAWECTQMSVCVELSLQSACGTCASVPVGVRVIRVQMWWHTGQGMCATTCSCWALRLVHPLSSATPPEHGSTRVCTCVPCLRAWAYLTVSRCVCARWPTGLISRLGMGTGSCYHNVCASMGVDARIGMRLGPCASIG